MARPSDGGSLQPSVFDRLIDLEPQSTNEIGGNRYSLNELRAAVRRDLEALLNTRKLVLDLPASSELQRSILTYGIPEVAMVNLADANEMVGLRKAIEDTIRLFEPRFLDVSVSIEPPGSTDRSLRFKIEARLDLNPEPEPLVFDSVLLASSGAISIVEAK
ncbi:MAG: type VI secretion system baseplate subunit TssE [Pyrinomonadaceae bacterium]